MSLQLVELLDRSREVGVGDEDLRTPGRRHPFSQRTTLTAVVRKRLEPDGTIALGGRIHDLARPVGAAVVHEDELVRSRLSGEIMLDLLDGAGEPLLLVVAGDDDAQLWR